MSSTPGIRIGRILGIPIYVDFSWILIFGVFCYALSEQLFRLEHKEWTAAQDWAAGFSTSVLFFACVVLHELAHSVVAQAYKIKVLSITLFVFGGLARISREPTKAMQEFNIAIAGPLASGFLAAAFYSLTVFFPPDSMLGSLW